MTPSCERIWATIASILWSRHPSSTSSMTACGFRRYNFFQPVMRLKEKTVIPQPGRHARIKRRFDDARTPFDRLCATGVLDEDRRMELEALRHGTNPRKLREDIYELIDKIFALPNAAQGSTQDVYQTLFMPSHPTKEQAIPVTLSNDRTITVR